MNDFYELQVAFDNPINFKGVDLYPATIRDYTIFKKFSEVLTINTINEKDIKLIGLPYLEYVYRKSKNAGNNIFDTLLLDMLKSVLSIVLKNDFFSIIEEDDGNVYLYIYTKTKEYDNFIDEYKELLKRYNNCSKIDKNLDSVSVIIYRKISEIFDKMYDRHTINSTEFDEMKKIICMQNDIDDSFIDPEWEMELRKARQKMNMIKRDNGLEFRDMLIAVSSDMNKMPNEIMDMSITTFDRYLSVIIKRESFNICKFAEANGAKFKREIEHWLTHYTPKSRYSDVVSDKTNTFMKELD